MQNQTDRGNFNLKTGMQSRCLFLMLFLLIGCFSVSHALASGPRKGGTLRFGTENDFAGFDVLKSSSRIAINGSIAANTIMEPLFRLDDKNNLIPVLGLSAEKIEDGKAWIIKLRKQVAFHDGTAFNADAVVNHWRRMLNPENKFRGRAALGPVISVTKVDVHTVRFDLKHDWLPFEKVISSTRGLANLIPSNKAVESGTQDRAPVGTGPFMFKSWESGDFFTVVKNPGYWGKGLPYLDEILFKPMPDAQTRFASLESGQMDIIWMDRGTIINKADKNPSLRTYASGDNGAEIFILNTSAPPLDHVDVRRALAHANNQARLVKMVYDNSIPIVHTPYGHQIQCGDDGYRKYDPDKARRLLAGFGQPVQLEVLHSNSQRGRDIGEITQQLFKDVGAAVNPVGLDFGPVIKKVLSGKYQMSTWRMPSHPDQGPALFRMFHSKSRANFSRYKNPEMDKLLVAQRMETDPAKRDELLCRISRLINEDVPIIYRGGMRGHIIAKDSIGGITSFNNSILLLETVSLDR